MKTIMKVIIKHIHYDQNDALFNKLLISEAWKL